MYSGREKRVGKTDLVKPVQNRTLRGHATTDHLYYDLDPHV